MHSSLALDPLLTYLSAAPDTSTWGTEGGVRRERYGGKGVREGDVRFVREAVDEGGRGG